MTNVEKALCAKHMYTLSDRELPTEIEDRLSKLESLLAPHLHKVDRACGILPHERKVIAGLFAVQYMRTPRMLAWWSELQKLFRASYELADAVMPTQDREAGMRRAFDKLRELLNVPEDSVQPAFNDWQRFQSVTTEQMSDTASRAIFDRGRRIRDTIAARRWAFLRSPEGKFVTADEPIRVSSQNGQNASIEEAHSIAFWPITPRCVLVVGAQRLKDGAWYTPTEVGCINHWIVSNATLVVTNRDADGLLLELDAHRACGMPNLFELASD